MSSREVFAVCKVTQNRHLSVCISCAHGYCRHCFHAYFPSIQPVYPKYDEESNRKQYEDTQKQRKYEHEIRKAKRQKAALVGINASEADI